ncbi:MAG: hypothetical protein ABJB47_01175 [Actinomycetota bacterium]
MGYVFLAVLGVALALTALGTWHVREATRPVTSWPSGAVVLHRAEPGGPCPCGGTIERMNGPRGEFLGCSNHTRDRKGCNRWWTLDGRQVIARPSQPNT